MSGVFTSCARVAALLVFLGGCADKENCLDLVVGDRFEARVVYASTPPWTNGAEFDVIQDTVLTATVRSFPREVAEDNDCFPPCNGGCIFAESDFAPVGRWTWTRIGTPLILTGAAGGRYKAERADGCAGILEAVIQTGELPSEANLVIDFRRDAGLPTTCPGYSALHATVAARKL